MKERKTNYAELAQLGEQVPYKHQVGGSSPSRRTKGTFSVPRSGKPERGRGDDRIALFGYGFLVINCNR